MWIVRKELRKLGETAQSKLCGFPRVIWSRSLEKGTDAVHHVDLIYLDKGWHVAKHASITDTR